ncbi:prolipoprotein diacylglyceryl transferase [Nocardioides fonticola]|uniref:Phosphatidylglycerol--prolipoprotein diacylglyceryl transferase n=1 Tax=Nocardioides fonticola TaxID=450363 RepID=A0ABP7XZ87_9ACTN
MRAYALCIITGIVVAAWLAERRLVRRGGPPGAISDIALWAVPFGILGGRLYHVLTDPELYFGAGRNPWNAFAVWNGGLGIWGAVALGAVGAWIGAHRAGVSFALVAEAVAPTLPIGQAIGRWGNWFNQELFGRPTSLPWGLQISPSHRPVGYETVTTFQPTFLYESLWDLGVAALVWWVGTRFRVGGFRLFAVYVAAYTVGRGWIEYLRIDKVNHIFGLRLNDWTSLLIFAAAVTFLVVTRPKTSTVRPTQGAGAISD